jgi:pyridoxine 4-dehydrogenase
MLTGRYKSADEIPDSDFLKRTPRAQAAHFDANLQLVRQVEALAAKKGCTPAQLAINWTRCLGKRPGMPVIIPIPGSTRLEGVHENSKLVDLTEEEMVGIDETLAKFEVSGNRYPDGVPVNT